MTKVIFQPIYDEPQPDDLSKSYTTSWGVEKLPRPEWQDYFVQALESIGFSSYGYPDDTHGEIFKPYMLNDGTTATDFENFTIRSYYWGDDEDCHHLPNFVAKKHDFTIEWYKYPLRGACCNRPISFKEFKQIMDEFVDEVKRTVK